MTRDAIVHLNARRDGDSLPGCLQTQVRRGESSEPSPVAMAAESSVSAQSREVQKIHRVTIREVAELAGVSTATVSNVINSTGKVGEATKQKVRDAIQATNWRPNLDARNLARGTAEKSRLQDPD